MKIIHTSDWHLGQTLYGYDRKEEHIYFFSQLSAVIEEEQPDAMVVSGDIYDVSNPSTAVVSIFNNFILDLKQSFPSLTIVIIAGNHDSASKIEAYRKVWKELGINIIGKIERIEKNYTFTENVVKVKDKGYIVAVPFINRAFMNFGENNEFPERLFFEKLENEVREINRDALPVVVMSHLTVNGCDLKSHRIPVVGNIEGVPSEIFGYYFDYIALGHIHKPQTLDNKNGIRYSGSPLAISFDEDFPHSISIVEVVKNGINIIREHPIEPLRPLITFPEKPGTFKTVIRLASKFPDDKECYLRLNVEQEEDLPMDCEEQACEATREKKCRYCLIKYHKLYSQIPAQKDRTIRLSDFAGFSPQEVAMNYFQDIGMSEKKSQELKSMLLEIQDNIVKRKNEES